MLGSGSEVNFYGRLEEEEFKLILGSFSHWQQCGLFLENIF